MRKHLKVNYVINLYIGKQPFSDTFLIFIDITKYELCVKYINSTSMKNINPNVHICKISYPYEQTIEFEIAFECNKPAT